MSDDYRERFRREIHALASEAGTQRKAGLLLHGVPESTFYTWHAGTRVPPEWMAEILIELSRSIRHKMRNQESC